MHSHTDYELATGPSELHGIVNMMYYTDLGYVFLFWNTEVTE